MTPPRTEYHTFEYLRRTLIQVHNRNVRRQFIDIKKPDNSPRNALNQSSLIRPTDPVGTILMRLGLYYFALGHIDQLASVAAPEIYDIRKDQNIPQLITIWRPKFGSSGNYKVSIPHYDGIRHPIFPTQWIKGDRVGTIWLKDNSFVRLYADSDAELNKMIAAFETKINPAYINQTVIGHKKGKPIKQQTLKPLKAYYYASGMSATTPNWVCYFDQDGICH